MRRGLLLVATTAACGRLGFGEQVPPGTVDAADPPIADAPPPIETLLTCDQPHRFQIGAAGIAQLVATPTNTGFAMVSVDAPGNLAAWAYEWGASGLAASGQNLALDTDATETLGITHTTGGILVAAVKGLALPTGTTVYSRNVSAGENTAATTYTEIAGERSLATNSDGQPIILEFDGTGVSARRLSTAGSYIGAPSTIVASSELPGAATINPGAGNGYVATWVSALTSPNSLNVARLDADLNVIKGPVVANAVGSGFEPVRQRIAWAKTSNTYLVTWHEKNGSDVDEIWMQILDADLAPVTTASIIATNAFQPKPTSDGTDFWVAWHAFGPNTLETVRISPTGVVTPRPVASSGGAPADWEMVEREGQAVVIWTEIGGTGPDLWLDAMCR